MRYFLKRAMLYVLSGLFFLGIYRGVHALENYYAEQKVPIENVQDKTGLKAVLYFPFLAN